MDVLLTSLGCDHSCSTTIGLVVVVHGVGQGRQSCITRVGVQAADTCIGDSWDHFCVTSCQLLLLQLNPNHQAAWLLNP
jgi:hypothetical protein